MSDASLERFRAVLRFASYSHEGASGVDEAFAGLHAELARSFPLVHSRLERELVAGRSLLYRWPGSGGGAPSVLMAHQDVVAVDDPERWTHPPFAAELVGDGEEAAVWARGALDDKAALVAILEAVESRLAAGFTPAADVYLAFGHDEESGGTGMEAIVALLAERGIRPGLVIDEGGAVMDGLLPGLGPTAVVGVTEKGIMNVELVVEASGGHAAIPLAGGATAVLARAILRREAQPETPGLSEPSIGLLAPRRARHPAPREPARDAAAHRADDRPARVARRPHAGTARMDAAARPHLPRPARGPPREDEPAAGRDDPHHARRHPAARLLEHERRA